MFNNLIESLNQRSLIAAERFKLRSQSITEWFQLLSQLELDSYTDLNQYLRTDTDRATLIALCEMIRDAKYVSHMIEKDEVVDSLVELLESDDW